MFIKMRSIIFEFLELLQRKTITSKSSQPSILPLKSPHNTTSAEAVKNSLVAGLGYPTIS